MRIDEIRLRNIGPHEQFDVELQSGLIGLLGPNGAGKSTLVNSIYAALTNDFSRFSNVKSDIITNNTGTKASYIKLVGSHQGQQFQLTRHLRPNKGELVIDGSVYTKATDINEAIVNQLGISKLVIDKYVFVNQWEMFQFLSQTASERAKTFQYLCGTEAATKIHKTCVDYVNRRKDVEIVDNSIELEEAIQAQTELMDGYKAAGQAATDQSLNVLDVEKYNAVLTAKDTADSALEELTQLEQKLGELVTDLSRKYLIQKKHEKYKENCRRDMDALEKDPCYQYAIKIDFETAESTLADMEDTQVNYQLTQIELDKLVDPVMPKNCLTEKGLNKARLKQGTLLTLQNQLMPLLEEQSGDSVCNHCNQPVTQEYIDTRQEEFDKRVEELTALEDLIDDTETYFKCKKKYDTTKAQLDLVLENLRIRMDELKVKLPKGFKVGSHDDFMEDASNRLDLYAEASKGLQEAEENIGQMKVKISKVLGKKQVTRETIAARQEVVDAMPTSEAVMEAQDMLGTHDEAQIQYQVAVDCFKNAKKTRGALRRTLKQLKLRLSEKLKIQNLLSTVSEAGDVFHWNNLPKQVSQANLELLVDDINDNLSMFNNPYFVEADEDLTFKVYFPGKSPVKATQLSGGQKVVLAIAFRIALDRVFGHEVGMMFLDEPTAGLDADNVSYFQTALQQLAQKVHEDRQLVVITHVQELGEVFDQLIEIQKE